MKLGLALFLSRDPDRDALIAKLQEYENLVIAAQESEAVWKTERDKADQRRIEAEAEVQKLKEQLEFAHVANRREIIAAQCLQGILACSIEYRDAEGHGSGVLGRAHAAILHADALIAALDDMEVGA